MSPLPPFLALLLALPSTLCAASAIILHNQCHRELKLQTHNLFSSKASTESLTIELADPIIPDPNPLLFSLPWPWTQAPTCIAPIPSVPSRLCVFTSSTFADGRGISIVTTPELARHAASLPAFTSPALLRSAKINEPTNLWHSTSIPGKGIGSLASQAIPPDTQILSHTPAFIAYLEHALPSLAREALWHTAISRLPTQTRQSFLDLSYVHQDPRVRTQAIVQANTFQLTLGGANHLAIFPETSRLNHDCAPNAQYVIDGEMLSHTVRTTRQVKEGEELGIAYTSPLEKAEVRRARMREGFGFECGCARCVDQERSDEVLKRIEELQNELGNWGAGSRGSPEMAERLVELYMQEGLEGFLDVPFGHAALACNAVGDVEGAMRWAERARRAVLGKDGRDAAALRVWREVLRDARRHWSYKRRPNSDA
ncbi:hypothetical protein E8E13_002502 [Curvularia kusanoi]|uniref:SET domain-containing protein n=1 Tax=Curvularia kusanoi TaxID=90978 RepID=A0A9P4WCS9_CURKU|nr:hypothetical protein E8E13_002502 [Curvularia kusanoi]